MCALNFDPKQCGISEEQWNALSAKKQEQFKAQWNAWSESKKEQFKEVMAVKDAASELSGDAIRTENTEKGFAVESSAPKPSSIVKGNTTPLEDNKALQDKKLAQYKKEYAELYKKNPDMANEDIADLVYTKEKYQIEEGLKKLKTTPDGQVFLADRYLREFASKEETAQFKESFERYLKEYEDDGKARDAFNGEFFVNDKEKYIRDGKTLTTAQRRMVAHRKALIETLNIDEDKIGKMATNFIKDRYLNGAMNKMAEFDKEISEALAKGDTKKADKLKEKANEYLKEAKTDEIKTKIKDTKKAIELMAEAKLEREIAEERVARRQIFYSKDAPGYDKNNPDHKVLTTKMKQFVDENPDVFKDKDGNFDSTKFKEFFVRVSNENETNQDGYDRADYMTSIENRKRGHDEKNLLKHEKALEEKYPDLKDPAKREAFLRDNPKIADELSFINTKAKLKDRRFQGACADISGLDKEKDKLALKKAEHVVISALKAGSAAFAMGALGEAFATTKVINADYAGILQFAGTVGYQGYKNYSGSVKYDGTANYSGSANYAGSVGYQGNANYSGSVGYQGNANYAGSVGYQGNANYAGSVGFQGNANYSGSVGYQGNANYAGSVGFQGNANYAGSVGYQGNANFTGSVGYEGTNHWTAGGTTPAEFTWEKWENGILEDNGTIVKDVPWTADGTANYSGSANYAGSVGFQGNANYSGSVGYHGNANYSGSVGFQGNANYSGSVGYQGNANYAGSVGYQGNANYSGSVGYQGNANYAGSVGYQGNANYSGSVGYQGQVNYSGEKGYQGSVEYAGEKDYQGEKEYAGVKRARHKFDWNVPIKAGIYGAVAGTVTGLLTMKNVKYNGGGPRIEARKKVAERSNTKKEQLKPIEAKPIKLHIPKADIDMKITIPQIKAQEFYDYKIIEEPGKEVSKAHEIQYKENPMTIVEGRYGVKAGTKEYDAIMGAMLKASGYEEGTNLKVGDKFTLPVVEVKGGKVYKPNDDASKVQKGEIGGTARVARLKEYKVQHFGGGYYVVDNTDPKNPKRLTGLLSKDQADAQLADLRAKAEKEGKKPRP